MILNEKFFVLSDLESTLLQRVRFWVKIFTTRKISNQLFYNTSDFELKNLHRVRFWVYFFYGLANFHAFIMTGHVSVMF